MKYQFLPHTGDIKIQVYGKTINEIFENTILAVSDFLTKGKKVKSKKGKVIEVSGTDYESLYYNFIEELIYLIDAEEFIAAKGEVTTRGKNLKAELYGDDVSNYTLDQIKSPTYSEMYIKKTKTGWEAQAVLDV